MPPSVRNIVLVHQELSLWGINSKYFTRDRGEKKEHSRSSTTDEQRRDIVKDDELDPMNLVLDALVIEVN